MKKYQRGFTLIELFVVIAGLVTIVGGGTAIYVAFHFIAKFW